MNFQTYKIKGKHGSEAYLITSGKDAVVIDTGYSADADEIIKKIDELLEDRELKHIILTHSHYDHVMGSPAIKSHFPASKIYAHPKVAEIFKKPNARKTMEELDQSAIDKSVASAPKGQAEKLHVDVDIVDGDIIDVGNMKIKIIETPGHTNDSISLYFINEDLVFISESLGVAPDLPNVVPAFIVSYADSVQSIKKIKELHAKNMIVSHSRLKSGEIVNKYLENALTEIHRARDIIISSYKKGDSMDETIETLKNVYYNGTFKKIQPSDALYANWIPMVTKLIQAEGL